MNGRLECLVSPSSATSCLPPSSSPVLSLAELPQTHSDLVKFASHDSAYDSVSEVLIQMHKACIMASTSARGT